MACGACGSLRTPPDEGVFSHVTSCAERARSPWLSDRATLRSKKPDRADRLWSPESRSAGDTATSRHCLPRRTSSCSCQIAVNSARKHRPQRMGWGQFSRAGGGRGIRTLDTGYPVYALSRRAPSTTRTPLQDVSGKAESSREGEGGQRTPDRGIRAAHLNGEPERDAQRATASLSAPNPAGRNASSASRSSSTSASTCCERP